MDLYMCIQYFQYSRRFPCPLFKSIPYPAGYHSQRSLPSSSFIYICSCTSCQQNHTLLVLLCLPSFAQQIPVRFSHDVAHINGSLLHCWALCVINLPQFIWSISCLSCFQLGANIIKIARNIFVHHFWSTCTTQSSWTWT